MVAATVGLKVMVKEVFGFNENCTAYGLWLVGHCSYPFHTYSCVSGVWWLAIGS
jgi:hypothetical protein